MDNIKNKLNIEEGTISFWTKENQINWSGRDQVVLFESSFDGNSLLIIKDSDSTLKFSHVFLGRGKTDIELDVDGLNDNQRHFIVATWSVKAGEIALYVDGGEDAKLKKIKKINYGTT